VDLRKQRTAASLGERQAEELPVGARPFSVIIGYAIHPVLLVFWIEPFGQKNLCCELIGPQWRNFRDSRSLFLTKAKSPFHAYLR